MKILFLTNHLRANDGWSRYARDIAVELQRSGNNVLCLVAELDPSVDIQQKKVFSDPIFYTANPLRSFLAARKVKCEIQQFNPDIIHVIVETYGTVLPFIDVSNRKIVMTVHSSYAFLPILVTGLRKWIATIFTKYVFRKTNLIICVSKYTEQYFINHMKQIGLGDLVIGKTVVLAGGVNFKSDLCLPREEKKTKEILFVGALKPRKGLLEAIDALSLVRADFVYRITGFYKENDPYVNLVKEKIKINNLEKKIVFEGRVDEGRLQGLYQRADLFLMPSINNGKDFEGYGLVYLEANMYGIPCVGPNDSGVSDAIVDGKTGYIVDPHNPQEVAQAVEQALGGAIDPENCVAWARDNDNVKKIQKIVEFYSHP